MTAARKTKLVPIDSIRRPKTLRARTPNQQKYLDLLESKTVIFATGAAGTGKSFLAVAKAIEALNSGEVAKLVFIRPLVEAGEHLGFLPGTLSEKAEPYMRPMFDAVEQLTSPRQLEEWLRDGVIEVAPIAFLRGRTLADSYIILDEAQNATEAQMRLTLTRLGRGSKIVLTGDPSQSDIKDSKFSEIMYKLAHLDDVGVVEFEPYDIQRSRVVISILEALDKE